jgi:hypothetical protein
MPDPGPDLSRHRFFGGRAVRMRRATLAAVAAACLGVVAGPPSAGAAAAASVVAPTPGLYNGLAVQWWQYVLGQPAATSPLTDKTGADCALGQSGPVFFLAGTISGKAHRNACVVGAGRELFFPLLNGFDVHTPADDQQSPALIYRDFLSLGFRADTLNASVDGVPVAGLDPATSPFHTCAAPASGCSPTSFAVQLPDGNLLGLPAGTYGPAVQEGWYLLLAPLSPGVHTISFGGSGFFGGPTSVDVTYRLTVAG